MTWVHTEQFTGSIADTHATFRLADVEQPNGAVPVKALRCIFSLSDGGGQQDVLLEDAGAVPADYHWDPQMVAALKAQVATIMGTDDDRGNACVMKRLGYVQQ